MLAVVLVLVCAGSLGAADGDAVRVKWVPDGDTLQLESGQWVRLQGIDAPETGRDGRAGQIYARAARAVLVQAAQGRVVTVFDRGRDRHGRILGLVTLPDGRDAADVLARRGLAFYYYHGDHTPALRARLLAAQYEAMDEARGFWPRILALPAASALWVGNGASHRAFPAASKAARSLSRAVRVPFDSLEAVFRAGYCPARAYSPWPEER